MEIKINDKILDASLDNESTIGEVLTNLEQWLTDSGHRISEIKIDSQTVSASMIEELFKKDIKSVKRIDVQTNVIAELTAASIINLLEDINEYSGLNFEDKTNYFSKWKESATAQFISVEIPDLYAFCVNTFSSGEVSAHTLISITEEIQREVHDPKKELENIEQILNEICERLVDLPLDIQTGKDSRAAQTIQVFSAVTEKIFRIIKQLDIQGYLFREKPAAENREKPITQLLTEFGCVLKDLLEAYEKNDSVLVGDLTEYEASPKLKDLYNAVMESIHKQEKTQGNK
ncbi:MAG: hypothetical protein FWD47_00565 [Treponema sp.]|nr:hypothetical protein [Treponema sp.]